MSSRRFLLVVGAPALPPQIAVGPEFVKCFDLATVRATGQNSKLIELTSDQWQFLRGVYAMNPEALHGLPVGDKAVFWLGRGDLNGLLLPRSAPCYIADLAIAAGTRAPESLVLRADAARGQVR
jgi:hypothetical protein